MLTLAALSLIGSFILANGVRQLMIKNSISVNVWYSPNGYPYAFFIVCHNCKMISTGDKVDTACEYPGSHDWRGPVNYFDWLGQLDYWDRVTPVFPKKVRQMTLEV